MMVKLVSGRGGMNSLSFEVKAEKGDVLLLKVMIPGGDDVLCFELEVREEGAGAEPASLEENKPE